MIFVLICLLVLIGAIITGIKETKNQVEERKKLEEESALAKKILQQTIENLSIKYGKPTNIIKFERFGEKANIKKCMLVFEENELLYVDDKAIHFKDIISYNIASNHRIKRGAVEYSSKTKTSTSSLLGRSVAGALIGGGVGAVIGASTASKKTTTIEKRGNDKVIQNYSLTINIRNLEHPVIKVYINSAQNADMINAVMECIIDRNR